MRLAVTCASPVSLHAHFQRVHARETDGVVPQGANLISGEPDEVRRRWESPLQVYRTKEDHILWVYVPHLKILPNDKGTIYVEFENGKVIKVFKME